MTVICALPLQVPVHRVRVNVRCRELGTVVHTAVRRLHQLGIDDDHIAAVLGLPRRRITEVRGELERRLALTEREYLMWVDHARGRCLPYSALGDGECAVRSHDAGLTLPVDPPTRASLTRMGLSAAASWDAGVSDGHVEIDDVLDVTADRRGSAPSGAHPLSHVLRLPDVQLLVSVDEDTADQPRISLAQHGVEHAQLTRWLHETFGERLLTEIIDLTPIDAPPQQPPWLAELGSAPEWVQLEPAPRTLRERITDVADAAEDRLLVCAPDLGRLPAWLKIALERVLERETEVLLCPANASSVPKGFSSCPVAVLAEQTGALYVVADASCAVVHTDAKACLEQGTTRVQRQYLVTADTEPAVRRVLEVLGLDPPVQLAASHRLGAKAVKEMLDAALSNLSAEVPQGASVAIEADDERFAAQTLDRYTFRGDSPTQTMRSVAAGIAWERVLIAASKALSEDHPVLEFVAARWAPAEGRIDLDVIVRDHRKRIVWILDAKNALPDHEQAGVMLVQLRVAAAEPAIATAGWAICGVIVHPSGKLRGEVAPRPTEQREVVRCALRGLPDLLLAATLPDQRVRERS